MDCAWRCSSHRSSTERIHRDNSTLSSSLYYITLSQKAVSSNASAQFLGGIQRMTVYRRWLGSSERRRIHTRWLYACPVYNERCVCGGDCWWLIREDVLLSLGGLYGGTYPSWTGPRADWRAILSSLINARVMDSVEFKPACSCWRHNRQDTINRISTPLARTTLA